MKKQKLTESNKDWISYKTNKFIFGFVVLVLCGFATNSHSQTVKSLIDDSCQSEIKDIKAKINSLQSQNKPVPQHLKNRLQFWQERCKQILDNEKDN